jgi:prepilin-type N-terminal cleavage/methylation domain-containing protein
MVIWEKQPVSFYLKKRWEEVKNQMKKVQLSSIVRETSGFTLIEIVVALLIFAISFVTFLGIQTVSLRVTLQNRNRQEALLAARSFLSFVEISDEALNDITSEGDLNTVANALTKGVIQFPEEIRQRYQARLQISNWRIKGIDNDALKRISLNILWGSNADQEISLVYFVPSN